MAREDYIVRRFDSMGAFLDQSKKVAAVGSNVEYHKKSASSKEAMGYERKGIHDWFGIPTSPTVAEDVAKCITNGWPAGVDKLMAALDDVEQPESPKSQKRRRVRGDFGDSIDMGRVWAGDLDRAWERCGKREAKSARTISIVCDVWATWKVTGEALFWRGAATLKLADLLTASGYSVEIIAACVSADVLRNDGREIKPENTADLIVIKEASAPLDLGSLAASVCLSGFLRMVCFQAMFTHEGRVTDPSCGSISTARKAKLVEDHQIDGLYDVGSREQARDWISKQIKAIEGMN